MHSAEHINQLLNDIPSQLGWPTVTEVTLEGDEAGFVLHVNPELPVFAGHFPEQPVLPGIVQLHWAAQLAQIVFGEAAAETGFRSLRGIKFNSMVLPDAQVKLKLAWNGEKLKFNYTNTETKFSNGVMGFVQGSASSEADPS